MGGMAIAMALRLDESGGLLPHVKVLMLLDRVADVYLAQRSGAEGWLIKPLDALRLKRAALAITNGEIVQEGVPRPEPPAATVPIEPDEARNARGRTSTRRVGSLPATGCSAAWLARHVRDVEAGGSNPLTPTSRHIPDPEPGTLRSRFPLLRGTPHRARPACLPPGEVGYRSRREPREVD